MTRAPPAKAPGPGGRRRAGAGTPRSPALYLALAAFALLAGATGSLGAGLAPSFSCSGALQAQASASPASGSAPFSAEFVGSACGGTAPYSYFWTFGNGASSTEESPSVTYAAAGNYEVSLEVNDSAQGHAWSNLTVSVDPSLGVAVSATSGVVPLSVVFWANVTGTSSPSTVTWQFGDGGSGSASGGSPLQHTYAVAGNYTATATVTVSGSTWVGHASEVVHAKANPTAPPPLALQIAPSPTSGTAPLPLNLTTSATGGVGPYALVVDFGDGGTQDLSDWHGTSTSFGHTYALPGSYTITATLTDSQGNVASSTAGVFVEGLAPLLATAQATVTSGNAPLTTSFVASASGGTPPYTISWAFGDGTFGSGLVGVPVEHTYTTPGTYTPTLTVTDGVGHSVTRDAPSIVVGGSSPSHGSSGGVSGLGAFWTQNGSYVGGIGLVAVLFAVALLEERRRHREAESEARMLVEAMESAKGAP